MSALTVCCVMLTCNRPALARRAVECFEKQTYQSKRLVIWDTGRTNVVRHHGHYQHCDIGGSELTVGALRNKANDHYFGAKPDILCHWDDDDYSAPQRIAEQVALMEATGAEVAGYNEMLFWRERRRRVCSDPSHDIEGEAWIYTGTILGTSLCYKRSVWERFPFPATSYGEDTEFLKQLQHTRIPIASASAVCPQVRMIARIHASNTSKAYAPEAMRAAPHHWRRAPEYDDQCRRIME